MFPWHMKLWIFGCRKQAYSELWISSSQSAQQMFMESSPNSTWFVIYLVQRFWNLTSIGCTPLSLCGHYFPCNTCSWGSMQVLCPHFVCILDPWDSPTYFEPFKTQWKPKSMLHPICFLPIQNSLSNSFDATGHQMNNTKVPTIKKVVNLKAMWTPYIL